MINFECSIIDGHLLDACKRIALDDRAIESEAQGVAAYSTYQIARTCGWQAARARLGRSAWYRHKQILREAGIPVPKGDGEVAEACGSGKPSTGWFGTSNADELAKLFIDRPSAISKLPNQRFEVVNSWPTKGLKTTDGSYTLDAWPVKSIGVVCRVCFDCSGWSVYIEHDFTWLSEEHRWLYIRLNDFFAATVPTDKPYRADLHDGGFS